MSRRKKYTAEMKVKIVREHLENQVSISELSERYGIHPNMIHKWKKELFEGAFEIFSKKHKKQNKQQSYKTKVLEEKLKKKDTLIAEIIVCQRQIRLGWKENIQLKKNFNGEI